MRIAILPTKEGFGWDGKRDPAECALAQLVTLDEFAAPQTTDTMSVAYSMPDDEVFPRLNLGSVPVLKDLGSEPLLTWAIFDIDNPGHAPWESLGDAAMAVYTATSALPDLPVGSYTTRAGFRLMFRLDPPLPVSVASSFLRQFGGWLSDRGVENIDPCSFEWTRLFRTPRASRDGEVLESLVDFAQLSKTLDPYSLGFALKEDVREAQDYGEAPPEPVDLDWDDWKHTADMPWAHLGQPVPPDASGSRYAAARSALARIASRGDYTDPHTLASFLWASVLATGGSSLNIGGLWDLACWVADRQEMAAQEDPEEKVPSLPENSPLTLEEWALVSGVLKGRYSQWAGKLKDGVPLDRSPNHYVEKTWQVLRVLAEKSDLPADFMYRAMLPSVLAQAEPLPSDLWDKCKELVEERAYGGEDNDKLRRVFCAQFPLTLACADPGTPLFQLDTTTTPPTYTKTSPDLIELHFDRLTRPNLPFEADYSDLPVRKILRTYGAAVKNIAYVSGQAGCVYDATNDVIHMGVHQLRPVRGKYHADIAEWLRLLGGSDPDGLLDWLSCVTYTTDQPLCSLFIVGGASVGKSLLGKGIASLWGSAPVDYNKVMNKDFNAELTTNPLLFADEGIVVDRNNYEGASQKFRNVVSDTSHHVNAKHRQPVPLRGAMRVLIAANGPDGLPFRQSLGKDGIEAIMQRVMYIRADDRAKDYLESLGGRDGIGGTWAPESQQPGAIAEHLIWLRDNHKTTPTKGGRFLVVGKPTDWHREFGVRQGIKPGVLQVIWALVSKLRSGVAAGKVLVREDQDKQVIWVHKGSVIDAWDTHSRSHSAKPADIQEALGQLAVEERASVRFGGNAVRKGYAVPFAAFVDSAVCDLEDLIVEEGT